MNPRTRCFLGIALLLTCVSLVACSSAKPEEVAQKILGKCKDEDDSGAYSLSMIQQDSELTVHYRYYPLGVSPLDEEMGVHLSSKIKRLYKEIKSLDTATFVVYLPYQDIFGNVTWKKGAQFTFTRALYNKINWDNFYGSDLVDVVETTWYVD